MKRLIAEGNRRDARWLVAIGVVGIVVGVATWFGMNEAGPSMAAGTLASVVGIVLWRLATDRLSPDPKCPNCGYGWGVGESAGEWLNWKCCPGCGLDLKQGTEDKR